MADFKNWNDYLRNLLLAKGQFALFDTLQKGDSILEFYKQQINDKETVVKVGYLKNGRLITLHITNPKTPGHNAEQIEYFYENDFDKTNRLSSVGLTFSEKNKIAITGILATGIKGREKKYFADNELQFSKVIKPIGENQELVEETHYFKDKKFWSRLLKKMITQKKEYTTEEIDLTQIFNGVK